MSHWVLDVISHPPDMPVLPHGPYLGLGLWNSLAGTLVVETAMVGAGAFVYLRSTRARDRIGSVGLVILLVFVGISHVGAYLGPPPPDIRLLAAVNLLALLPVLGAAWIDSHREPIVHAA